MIERLTEILPEVHKSLSDKEEWDSLVINRRKPWTYRIFRQFGDYRVCLHTFLECGADEAFLHPHPWPGAFLILKGSYVQTIGFSQTKDKDSMPNLIYREVLSANSMYEILDQKIWHSVQPLSMCYTVMINGQPWDEPHQAIRTTKGKDLQKLSPNDFSIQKKIFLELIETYMGDTLDYYHNGRQWIYDKLS